MKLLQALLESTSRHELLALQQRLIDDAHDEAKIEIVPLSRAFRHWVRVDDDEMAQRGVMSLGFDAVIQVQLRDHVSTYIPGPSPRSLYRIVRGRVEVIGYIQALEYLTKA